LVHVDRNQGEFIMFLKNLIFLMLCIFFVACQSLQVPIKHMAAAEGNIPGDVQRIAILPYDYNESADPTYGYLKDSIADKVANEITSYGTYSVAERARLNELMQEAMASAGAVLTPEKMNQIGKVTDSQAIVVGRINVVSIQDQHTSRSVEVPADDPYAPPMRRNFPYIIRSVTLNVTSEMLHVGTKQKIITDSFRETYNSEKDKDVIGGFFTIKDEEFYASQPGRVPAIDDILTRMASAAAHQFIKKISAHPHYFNIALKEDSHPSITTGMEWAKNGNYERAAEAFKEATNNPKSAAVAWFNIGVCYESIGRYSEAKNAYESSLRAGSSPEAMDGVSRLRKYQGL